MAIAGQYCGGCEKLEKLKGIIAKRNRHIKSLKAIIQTIKGIKDGGERV